MSDGRCLVLGGGCECLGSSFIENASAGILLNYKGKRLRVGKNPMRARSDGNLNQGSD